MCSVRSQVTTILCRWVIPGGVCPALTLGACKCRCRHYLSWPLRSTTAPHGHLPSPGVLLVLVLARLMHPAPPRYCSLALLSGCKWPSINGISFVVYQWIALRLVLILGGGHHITTLGRGARAILRLFQASGYLYSHVALANSRRIKFGIVCPEPATDEPLRLLFIGRFDSYKRLDWLLEARLSSPSPWQLVVVGDGPKRSFSKNWPIAYSRVPHPFDFYGFLSEFSKLEATCHGRSFGVASDCSNEAFGIVQFEAMAAGRISLAFDLPRSGMGWVCRLPGFAWSQSPDGLVEVLQRLSDHPNLRQQLCVQARQRYCKLFRVGFGCTSCIGWAIWWKGVRSETLQSERSLVFEPLQLHPVQDRPPVLELENVGLEIPVLTTETRSLKSTLIRSVTGGVSVRSRGGAVITALQDISLKIPQRRTSGLDWS